MKNELRPGLYRHFKGGLYTVLGVAQNSETCEKMVVYRAEYGNHELWVRPLDLFTGPVDRNKYPDADQTERFRFVGDL